MLRTAVPELTISKEIENLLDAGTITQLKRSWRDAHKGKRDMICVDCRRPIPGKKPEPGTVRLTLGLPHVAQFVHQRCGSGGLAVGDEPIEFSFGSPSVMGDSPDVAYREFRTPDETVAGIVWKPLVDRRVPGSEFTYEELIWKGHGARRLKSFQTICDAPALAVPPLAHTFVRLSENALDVMFATHTFKLGDVEVPWTEASRMTIGEDPPFSPEWREAAGKAGEVRCVIVSSDVDLDGTNEEFARSVEVDFARGRALAGRAPYSVYMP